MSILFTAADCKSWGYCVSGQRKWCELQGVDFRDFVKNGMSLARARTFVDDAVADDVIRRVLERERLK